MPVFDQSCFWDEDAAARVIEAVRWPQGAECPGCGALGRVRPIAGRTTASGSFKCYACSRRFTVRTGSTLEGSHIPLSRWLRAVLLVACATRPVACKHLEESCGVAPRIARSLRQRLIQCLAEPAGIEDSDLETASIALRAALPDDRADRLVFADICRSLGVPAGSCDVPFLLAVRAVVGHDRRAPESTGAGRPGDGVLVAAPRLETWREVPGMLRCA